MSLNITCIRLKQNPKRSVLFDQLLINYTEICAIGTQHPSNKEKNRRRVTQYCDENKFQNW